jgi:DNA repair protein RecN (Recombination protein N)
LGGALIENLRIRDLAVVEDAELDLGPGLNVLTGETGAGKSLVLGALELLAGRRAASDRVRTGCDAASVEAVFRAEGPEWAGVLEERGLDAEEGELVARRSVSAAGRSRAWLGGQLVPVSSLSEVLGERIEIASQHESQALRRPEAHGRLLDAYGGLLEARLAVTSAYTAVREADEEIARLRSDADERARRRDYLDFQIREIDEAELVPGELDQLETERARLVHAERLCADSGAAARALGGDPTVSEAPGAADLVADAARRVADLAEIDPALAPQAELLSGAHAEISDAAAELERYAQGIDADPGRQAEVEERLDRLERLRRKYGGSIEEILAFRDRAAREREDADTADDRLSVLDAERGERAQTLKQAAAKLSRGRKRAAKKLAAALGEALEQLALPEAGVEIALDPAPGESDLACGPTGAEIPQLLFRANPGEPARPLRRVASGGELSRVFLAVKNVLRSTDSGLVLVFDEVDAGVGGAVAEAVGRALAELAEQHQVLCITHLPQVAALASTHFRVEKSTSDGRTQARVARLEGDARVEEIARMAGGRKISAATRSHARELLGPRARA